jgi:hypothetical protein
MMNQSSGPGLFNIFTLTYNLKATTKIINSNNGTLTPTIVG